MQLTILKTLYDTSCYLQSLTPFPYLFHQVVGTDCRGLKLGDQGDAGGATRLGGNYRVQVQRGGSLM